MFVQLLFKLPMLIIRGINAICYYFTALLIVFYGILTGGPRTPDASLSAQQSQDDEYRQMSNINNQISEGAEPATFENSIQRLSRQYGWDANKQQSVRNNFYGTYYARKINEFIDANDELYNVPDIESVLRRFDDLMRQANNYLETESRSQFQTEFKKRVINNAKNEINTIITTSPPGSVLWNTVELPKIQAFYKAMGYSPSKIETTIKEFSSSKSVN